MLTSTAFSVGQMQMSDYQQAQTISTQIAATAQKSEMERWKILQDTQTKIFEIQQEVTVNRAKTQDKLFNKWDDYIKSELPHFSSTSAHVQTAYMLTLLLTGAHPSSPYELPPGLTLPHGAHHILSAWVTPQSSCNNQVNFLSFRRFYEQCKYRRYRPRLFWLLGAITRPDLVAFVVSAPLPRRLSTLRQNGRLSAPAPPPSTPPPPDHKPLSGTASARQARSERATHC